MKKKKITFYIFVVLVILAFYLINLFHTPDGISLNDSINVANGYKASVVAKGLKNPSSFFVDDNDNIFIAENNNENSKIIEYTKMGEYKSIICKDLYNPVTYITQNKGIIYVSHKGKVSKIEDGVLKDIVKGLPSLGDYSNNGISFGNDSMIYICQGAATNSGVVGNDNYENGWLKENKYFHDMPPLDVYTSGVSYKSKNPFTADENDAATTGAFSAYNVHEIKGTQVKGQIPGNACILRTTLDGSYMDVFSFGVRNPTSIITMQDGKTYVSVQGMEERGSRPIANGKDYIYEISKGMWLGWPDYEGGESVCQLKFKPKNGVQPQFVTEIHQINLLQRPLISFPESGRIGIIDISKNSDFGAKGQLYIPLKSKKNEVGKVVRYDLKTGEVIDFITCKNQGIMDTPIQCLFSKNGSLYILYQNEGIIFKIDKESDVNLKNMLPKYIPIEYLIVSIIILIVFYIIISVRKENK